MKRKEKNVIILRKSSPYVCGGTDATLDKSAPKVIKSNDMVLFSVKCRLSTADCVRDNCMNYVSAFAAKTSAGSFLFLHTFDYFRENVKSVWALIKGDIFPALDSLVREFDFADKNGYHSTTHGLPENFGGSVETEYSSGEKISFSDNQSSVISYDAGIKIADIFGEYVKSEKVPLPDVSDLKEIRFCEERNPGFTKAVLKINPDGTAVNCKSSKYEDEKVYESEKSVDKDTVSQIKKRVADCGILAWRYLPESKFTAGNLKTLTFVFGDGTEIEADNVRTLPVEIGGGFFDVELEISVKH